MNQTKILVVDDEASIRQALSGILEDEGFDVFVASDGQSALDVIAKEQPAIVLLDIWMPGIDGLTVLREVRKRFPAVETIVMSGHGNIETAVKATKLGAYDFVEKPLSFEKIMIVVNNLLEFARLKNENAALLSRVTKDLNIVGESESIRGLRGLISRVALTQSWVLITGENGTGKELVAQNIHYQSVRAAKAFVEVNCAAIPEDLIESELFGHEKGAFTGATSKKKGKFDLAHGGTLFLDEIADMSLKTQAKVLRILQEQKFERVGGAETIMVDVRVVAATNKNLEAEIKAGRFRDDLYYRLNVIPVRVPPLRERKSDIPLLVKYFSECIARKNGVPPVEIKGVLLESLTRYDWPGNVRELRNIVERIYVHSTGSEAELAELEWDFVGAPAETFLTGDFQKPPGTLREARAHFEREFIVKKLAENEGNISKTAESIGLERSHLHRKMKGYGIDA